MDFNCKSNVLCHSLVHSNPQFFFLWLLNRHMLIYARTEQIEGNILCTFYRLKQSKRTDISQLVRPHTSRITHIEYTHSDAIYGGFVWKWFNETLNYICNLSFCRINMCVCVCCVHFMCPLRADEEFTTAAREKSERITIKDICVRECVNEHIASGYWTMRRRNNWNNNNKSQTFPPIPESLASASDAFVCI